MIVTGSPKALGVQSPFPTAVTATAGLPWINVKDYGAVGDGVHDDAINIQSAITAAIALHGRVLLPPGTYLVNTGLTITGTISLVGASHGNAGDGGVAGTTITTTADITMLSVSLAASASFIFGIRFQGPGVGTSTLPGVLYTNSNYTVMEKCTVTAFNVGVRYAQGATGSYINRMTDCLVISNKVINIDAQSNTNLLRLDNVSYGGISQTGLKATDCNNILATGCDCEGVSVCGNDLDATGTLNASHTFVGCHYELDTNTVGVFRIGNTAAVNGVSIFGCLFKPGAGADSAINAIHGDDLRVVGGALVFSYTGVTFHRIGAAFGSNVEISIGNYGAPRRRNNFYTADEINAQFQQPTTYDAAEDKMAQWNLLRLTSGATLANKTYYGAWFMAHVLNFGGAAGAGHTVYGARASGQNNVGSTINTRAFLADGALDLTDIAVAYSASMTINAAVGNSFQIIATDGVAFAINAPLNPVRGQQLVVSIVNASGGALGVVTWNAAFKMSAWTQPANTFNRSITFKFNGVSWQEKCRTPADVPN